MQNIISKNVRWNRLARHLRSIFIEQPHVHEVKMFVTIVTSPFRPINSKIGGKSVEKRVAKSRVTLNMEMAIQNRQTRANRILIWEKKSLFEQEIIQRQRVDIHILVQVSVVVGCCCFRYRHNPFLVSVTRAQIKRNIVILSSWMLRCSNQESRTIENGSANGDIRLAARKRRFQPSADTYNKYVYLFAVWEYMRNCRKSFVGAYCR